MPWSIKWLLPSTRMHLGAESEAGVGNGRADPGELPDGDRVRGARDEADRDDESAH